MEAGKIKKTLIFDLDGTLIDSLNDIAVSMNTVLNSLALKSYKISDYKNFVGGGVDYLVKNVLQDEYSKTFSSEVTKEFKKVYEQALHSSTKPYEGIVSLLDELVKQDCNIAVLSNKPHEFTKAYVNKLFSKYNLKQVHGQKSTIPKKPDPTAAINIAKSFQVPCCEVYFIGDTKTDMSTAKNANMIAIGVLWGFRPKEELLKYGADYLVSHPMEILDIINNKQYKAISCVLYDSYEAFSVKKTKLKILYFNGKEKKEILDYIIRLETKNKEEFMVLNSGIKIRLDRIIELTPF